MEQPCCRRSGTSASPPPDPRKVIINVPRRLPSEPQVYNVRAPKTRRVSDSFLFEADRGVPGDHRRYSDSALSGLTLNAVPHWLKKERTHTTEGKENFNHVAAILQQQKFLEPEVVTSHTASRMPPKFKASVRGAKVVTEGYGFVRFADDNERVRAMTEMNGIYCSSRPMQINAATPKKALAPAQPQAPQKAVVNTYASSLLQNVPVDSDPNNTTIFVGGLDPAVSEEELQKTFGEYGWPGNKKVQEDLAQHTRASERAELHKIPQRSPPKESTVPETFEFESLLRHEEELRGEQEDLAGLDLEAVAMSDTFRDHTRASERAEFHAKNHYRKIIGEFEAKRKVVEDRALRKEMIILARPMPMYDKSFVPHSRLRALARNERRLSTMQRQSEERTRLLEERRRQSEERTRLLEERQTFSCTSWDDEDDFLVLQGTALAGLIGDSATCLLADSRFKAQACSDMLMKGFKLVPAIFGFMDKVFVCGGAMIACAGVVRDYRLLQEHLFSHNVSCMDDVFTQTESWLERFCKSETMSGETIMVLMIGNHEVIRFTAWRYGAVSNRAIRYKGKTLYAGRASIEVGLEVVESAPDLLKMLENCLAVIRNCFKFDDCGGVITLACIPHEGFDDQLNEALRILSRTEIGIGVRVVVYSGERMPLPHPLISEADLLRFEHLKRRYYIECKTPVCDTFLECSGGPCEIEPAALPPKLTQKKWMDKRAQCRVPKAGSLFISLARRALKLTPERFGIQHESAAAILQQPKSVLKLTVPKEPKLVTSHRARPSRFKSCAELEEEMMLNVPKFKARPVNKKILEAPTLPPISKSNPQLPKFQEFHLRTTERALQHVCSSSAASSDNSAPKELPQLHTAARARPVKVKSREEPKKFRPKFADKLKKLSLGAQKILVTPANMRSTPKTVRIATSAGAGVTATPALRSTPESTTKTTSACAGVTATPALRPAIVSGTQTQRQVVRRQVASLTETLVSAVACGQNASTGGDGVGVFQTPMTLSSQSTHPPTPQLGTGPLRKLTKARSSRQRRLSGSQGRRAARPADFSSH